MGIHWGQEAQDRLKNIAQESQGSRGVTRLPFTKEHYSANRHITKWMESAGLSVHLDAAGTLIGRRTSAQNGPSFLIGSHQDSVPNGGRYDGIMGVVVGCLALEKLRNDGVDLRFGVEVLAFADEEGVRFPTALMGPRALAGTFDTSALAGLDDKGVTLEKAMLDFGVQPQKIGDLARPQKDVLGYLEIHIEQGPVLERHDAALGIVTGICGIERNAIRLEGQTGHAGTVPMQGRQDALVAASWFISFIHQEASALDDLRATVGHIKVWPNVVNAIPSIVDFTLEIRGLEDDARRRFSQKAHDQLRHMAKEYDLCFTLDQTYEQIAVPCSPKLQKHLDHVVRDFCPNAPFLPSGATHDASAMSDLCEIAMLFVRCKNGVSHCPEEYASAADMQMAVDAVAAFLKNLHSTF